MNATHCTRRGIRALAPLFLIAACGGEPSAIDAPTDAPDLTPRTLAETGLCLDPGCMQISADARSYQPRFELWADTATKRRWISIPPGTKIDTSNMNAWVFPQGTKLWKEFTRDGVRVETRLMTKVLASEAVDAWAYATYQWNAAQTEAVTTTAFTRDANGTGHDIPARTQCDKCHERTRPRVLGFDAIQLDRSAPAGSLDLADLIQMNLLSAPPAGQSPHFPLPGAAVVQTAFGYLHANCGNCHNPVTDVFQTNGLDLRLDTTKLATVTGTPTYQTTVNVNKNGEPVTIDGVGYTIRVAPRQPDQSLLVLLSISLDPGLRMPPFGTEQVDSTGQAALRVWINSL